VPLVGRGSRRSVRVVAAHGSDSVCGDQRSDAVEGVEERVADGSRRVVADGAMHPPQMRAVHNDMCNGLPHLVARRLGVVGGPAVDGLRELRRLDQLLRGRVLPWKRR
jgi:hypothetical protein